MTAATITARARVQITIEMDAGSVWGEDCPVAQILRQAGKESVTRLTNVLQQHLRAIVIGEPRVLVVMAENRAATEL